MATNFDLELRLNTDADRKVRQLGDAFLKTGRDADKAQQSILLHEGANLKAAKTAATAALATDRLASSRLKDAKAADVAKRSTDRTATTKLKEARTSSASALATDRLAAARLKNARTADVSARTTDRLSKAQARNAGTARKAGTATSSLTGFLKKGLVAGAAALAVYVSIGAAMGQISAGVNAAVRIEAVSIALDVASGSAMAGANALAFVRSEADRLGLSIGPTASEFAKLSAAAIGTSLAGKGVRDIFSAVSEAGARLSLSADQQSGALLALGQIMSKGKLLAEELTQQLGERIPGALGIMARGLGVSTDKLFKMMETGNVLATVALPAFARELRKTFGTDATTRIDTAAAGLARFETAVFDAQTVLGKAFLPALGDVTKQIADFLKENERAIRSVGQWVGIALKSIVTFGLGAAKSIGVVVEGWSALLTVVSDTGAFDVAKAAFEDTMRTWRDVGGVLGALEEVRGEVFAMIASIIKFAGESVASIFEVVAGLAQIQIELAGPGAALAEFFGLDASGLIAQGEKLVENLGFLAEGSREAARENAKFYEKLSDDSFDAAIRVREDAKTMKDALDEVADAAGGVASALGGIALAERLGVAPGQLAIRDPFASLDPSAGVAARGGAPGLAFMQRQSELIGETLRDQRLEREREFKLGLASRKSQNDELEKSQDRARERMSRGFDAIAATLGLFDAGLANVVGNVLNVLEQLASGTAGGGAVGGFLSGVTKFAPLISAAIGTFDAIKSFLEGSDEKKFGIPVEAGITGGQFRGQAIGTGALTDIQAVRAVQGMRDAIDAFRTSAGLIITDLPKIGIAMRNDGEEFELTVAGVVQGVFSSFEEAFSAGLRTALGGADFSGIGPVLQAAIASSSFGESTEQLLEMIPVLREIDDLNAGLTAGYSAARLAADQWLTTLDVESETLLGLNVSIEDVIAHREREIAAQQRLLEASGAALAGVSLNIVAFEEWANAARAFGDAQETEIARQEALRDRADTTVLSPGGFPLAPPGGGIEGGRGAREARGDFVGFGGAAAGAGEMARGATPAIESYGVATQESAEQAQTAGAAISDAFIDMVRDAVAIQGELGFFREIQRFQERFGFQLIGNEDLRRQIAKLEFRSAQIRIVLLVRELQLNAEILGITDQVIAKWQGFASDIAALDFSDATIGGTQGAGGGRRGRRQARQTAAEQFRELVSGIRDELEESNPVLAEYADRQDVLTEAARKGKIGAEELAAGLASLAELQLLDLTKPFAATAAAPGSDPLETFQELASRQLQALAAALELAADDPGAFAEAAAAINAGVASELASLGTDLLDTFGSPFRAIRQESKGAQQNIRFLINHLEDLGLTASQVANTVRQGLFAEVLSFAERAARALPAGTDAEALSRAQEIDRLATLRSEFERKLALLRLTVIEQELKLAGALDAGMQELIASSRTFLSATTQMSSAVDELNAAARDLPVFRPPTDPDAGRDARGSLADIVHRLTDEAMNQFESAADRFQHIMEEISTATGTAADRTESVRLAEERLGSERSKILDDLLSPFETPRFDTVADRLGDIARQFDEIADGANLTADEIRRVEAARGEATQQELDDIFGPLRDALDAFDATDPRRTSEELFTTARSQFASLVESARGGDLGAIARLPDAIADFATQTESFLGGGIGSLGARDQILAARSLLPEDFLASQIADPVVEAVDSSNVLLANIRDLLKGDPSLALPLVRTSGTASLDIAEMREIVRAMLAQERREIAERARDRQREKNTEAAHLEQRGELVAAVKRLVTLEEQEALEARIGGAEAGGTGA